jgi:CRISPR-associated protein Cas2
VAEALAAYGLSRIQRSAFVGRLPSPLVKELEARLRRLVADAHADVQIFKIDRGALEGRIWIAGRWAPA